MPEKTNKQIWIQKPQHTAQNVDPHGADTITVGAEDCFFSYFKKHLLNGCSRLLLSVDQTTPGIMKPSPDTAFNIYQPSLSVDSELHVHQCTQWTLRHWGNRTGLTSTLNARINKLAHSYWFKAEIKYLCSQLYHMTHFENDDICLRPRLHRYLPSKPNSSCWAHICRQY